MSEQLAVAKSHGLHVREVRADKREADFVASTDAIDSYGDVVEQTWRLERFHANPVVLYAHQSRELPIGTATFCDVRDGKLQCTIRFVTEDKNPKAEQVWRMVRDKELRAVSVGFMPHSYRFEKHDDQEVLVLADNELLEISVVPIPANPEALAKMKSKAREDALNNQCAFERLETKTMNEKEMQDRVAKSDAEKAHAEKVLAEEKAARQSAETKLLALDGALSKMIPLLALVGFAMKSSEPREEQLVAAVDGLAKDHVALKDQVVELEVSALVGIKIDPAEKDDFVELKKSNPKLFDKMVAQRADKKLTEKVVGSKLPPPTARGEEPDLTKPKSA